MIGQCAGEFPFEPEHEAALVEELRAVWIELDRLIEIRERLVQIALPAISNAAIPVIDGDLGLKGDSGAVAFDCKFVVTPPTQRDAAEIVGRREFRVQFDRGLEIDKRAVQILQLEVRIAAIGQRQRAHLGRQVLSAQNTAAGGDCVRRLSLTADHGRRFLRPRVRRGPSQSEKDRQSRECAHAHGSHLRYVHNGRTQSAPGSGCP